MLEDRSISEQTIIIERMIKVNHPSLGNDNRSNLQRMYPYLLQHLNDNSGSIVSIDIFLLHGLIIILYVLHLSFYFQDGWNILNSLAPHFYDLTQFFPEYAAKCFIDVLKEKHTDFVESTVKQITSDTVISKQTIF